MRCARAPDAQLRLCLLLWVTVLVHVASSSASSVPTISSNGTSSNNPASNNSSSNNAASHSVSDPLPASSPPASPQSLSSDDRSTLASPLPSPPSTSSDVWFFGEGSEEGGAAASRSRALLTRRDRRLAETRDAMETRDAVALQALHSAAARRLVGGGARRGLATSCSYRQYTTTKLTCDTAECTFGLGSYSYQKKNGWGWGSSTAYGTYPRWGCPDVSYNLIWSPRGGSCPNGAKCNSVCRDKGQKDCPTCPSGTYMDELTHTRTYCKYVLVLTPNILDRRFTYMYLSMICLYLHLLV